MNAPHSSTAFSASATSTLQQLRIDLTAALRCAARMGLNEGICNHFSAEIPGDNTLFLINPQGLHWSEIHPSDLVLMRADGSTVEGKHAVEPTAFFIHSQIHARKGKKVVLHTHMPYATALTVIAGGRLDCSANQNAMRFHERITYDEGFGGPALDAQEGERISSAMGNGDITFMAHHGVTVCGDRIDYAFDDLYYLERSCMVQLIAESTGRQLRQAPLAMVQQTQRMIEGERQQSELHFKALKRLLDRDEPGWSFG